MSVWMITIPLLWDIFNLLSWFFTYIACYISAFLFCKWTGSLRNGFLWLNLVPHWNIHSCCDWNLLLCHSTILRASGARTKDNWNQHCHNFFSSYIFLYTHNYSCHKNKTLKYGCSLFGGENIGLEFRTVNPW